MTLRYCNKADNQKNVGQEIEKQSSHKVSFNAFETTSCCTVPPPPPPPPSASWGD